MGAPITLAVQPVDDQRRKLCIELLEKMLAEAKEGSGFETVFLVVTFPDSTVVRHAWTAGLSLLDMVGRLEHLKHEILADAHDGCP